MDEKIITLTDGTKLEVKVNFMTLYLIQKHGLDKVINKEALSEDENMVHMEHRQIQLILMQHRLHMVLCQ